MNALFTYRRFLLVSLALIVFVFPLYGVEPEQEFTALFAGDIYLGGGLESIVLKDPLFPFRSIQELCTPNQLFCANLEGPLSSRGEVYVDKTFTFRTNPQVVNCLLAGGINLLSLANNHIMDFGPEALADTLSVLEENNIAYAGAGKNRAEAHQAALLEINRIKIAFLAYNCTYPLEFNAGVNRPGTARGLDHFISADVKKARQQANIVIVAFHWSSELLKERKPYQSYYAKVAIDSGAHLVIGHHPHVIQGVEVYKNALIAYSLGNFIFASYSRNVQDALLLQVELTASGVKNARFYPLNVNNYQVHYQPQLYTGPEAKRVLQELQTLSQPLGTSLEIIDNHGVIRF